MKKAILFGATGFIGSHLLEELLNNADYERVTVVVRRPLNIHHPKLITLIGDYHTLPKLAEKVTGDEIFIALGTTKANTPDPAAYYQVDHDYPVLASKIAKENGVKSVFIVTSLGANANSGMVYIRTKGEIERDILALDFRHSHFFRLSMVMGNRKEDRRLEKLLIKLFSVINPLLIGKNLKRYRGIAGEDVAKAMNNAAKKQSEKAKIYHWQEIIDLL